MKTNNKLSAYILRGSTAALLFSCVLVTLCPAIHLPEQSHKAPAPQDNAAFDANAHQSRSLKFSERVAYQRAIEDVYWRHRIWPDTNAGPKPSLDAVMSQAQLEKKVEDYLRNSQTLEVYWQKPISADQLEAELERMASHTKQPDVLRELFDALGNDPFVIAECLARPVLAERLIADLSAQHQTGRLESLRTAELRTLSTSAMLGQVAYTLPVIASPSGGCIDNWVATSTINAPTAALTVGQPPAPPTHLPHAPGTYEYEVNWNEAVEPTSIQASDLTLSGDTGATVTSVEVINGDTTTRSTLKIRFGGSLTADIAAGRITDQFGNPNAAFSGSNTVKGPTPTPTPTPLCVPPPPNMVSWWPGDDNADDIIGSNNGTLHNGATFAPGMVDQAFSFDGVDDYVQAPDTELPFGTVARTLDFWMKPIFNARIPVIYGDYEPNDAFYILVQGANACIGQWGGGDVCGSTDVTDGSWHHVALTYDGIFAVLYVDGALETNVIKIYTTTQIGTLLIGGTVVSGDYFTGLLDEIEIFNCALSQADIQSIVNAGSAGKCKGTPTPTPTPSPTATATASPSGGCIDDTWTPTTLTNAPIARYGHTAVWTGSEMIVWGGYWCGNYENTGGRYDPTTDSWTATSTTNAPSARGDHTAVWTGTEMIVWGGRGNAGAVNTGGRYNPITDSWTATTTTNAPVGRYWHTAVLTGSEMIIWGGNSNVRLNTGGRYNPSTDSWTATSTTNAPDVRYQHTAVWDDLDNLMIVWGGEGDSGVVNTGGRYDPGTDSWTATTTTNAPSPRSFSYNWQVAGGVWTGSEMIVWGGFVSVPGGTNTGGRYNPGTDSWTATSMINVPTARYQHTVVWTGTEMIVWGGLFGDNTGGRYDPGTDSWRTTSIINASARRIHTAVWTGSEMIVWGGTVACCPIVVSNTGGRYCAQSPTPSPTPACPPEYLINQIGGSIVPGTTDIGNHGDNVVTTIALPFPYTLYDQTFTQIALDSNGKAHFLSGTSDYTNTCLPYTVVTYAVFPYWDDQLTNAQDGCAAFPGGTCGIFTSVSGAEPNRIFNIEWRTVYFNDISQAANYELKLYEGQTRFDVIYGAVAQGNTDATAGVQRDHTFFDQYFCNGSGGAATGGQSYVLQPCVTPTPTPTATPRVTPRPRPTPHPRP